MAYTVPGRATASTQEGWRGEAMEKRDGRDSLLVLSNEVGQRLGGVLDLVRTICALPPSPDKPGLIDAPSQYNPLDGVRDRLTRSISLICELEELIRAEIESKL